MLSPLANSGLWSVTVAPKDGYGVKLTVFEAGSGWPTGVVDLKK